MVVISNLKSDQKILVTMKKYWNISEISEIIQCETSAIRFWEIEGVVLPTKSIAKGSVRHKRLYDYDALRLLVEVAEMLHVHGMKLKAVKMAILHGYKDVILKNFRALKKGLEDSTTNPK